MRPEFIVPPGIRGDPSPHLLLKEQGLVSGLLNFSLKWIA
jgi:hypothetical protein